MMNRLSLVLPALNEAERLAITIPEIGRWLDANGRPGAAEIVLVDDGSTDDTRDAARELLRGRPHRILSFPENRGKGRAVKEGMLAASGDVRLFMDADLSTPLDEIPRLVRRHARGYDVAIGSRNLPGARVEKHQPVIRESMGKIFTFLSSTLVVSGISDFTCGFKSFTGDAAEDLFPLLTLDEWSFDAELLWLARCRGHRIAQVPVRWRDDPRTRVDRIRDGVRSLHALLTLCARRHLPNGRYR